MTREEPLAHGDMQTSPVTAAARRPIVSAAGWVTCQTDFPGTDAGERVRSGSS